MLSHAFWLFYQFQPTYFFLSPHFGLDIVLVSNLVYLSLLSPNILDDSDVETRPRIGPI